MNTHGRLYDQWTIPDLADYDDLQRQKYRAVVQSIDQEIIGLATKPLLWRPEPMTSRQHLLDSVDQYF